MTKDELKKIIKDSAKSNKVLRISYTDSKQDTSIRNVEPYEIRGENMWAYCRKKKGIRQFNLNRIDKAKVTNYSYLPKWPVKFDDSLIKTASLFKQSAYQSLLYEISNSAFGDYEEAELD